MVTMGKIGMGPLRMTLKVVSAELPWASKARTVPRTLGRIGNRKEDHIRTARPARGAAGAAVDAGRADGVNKSFVGAKFSRKHKLPARFIHY